MTLVPSLPITRGTPTIAVITPPPTDRTSPRIALAHPEIVFAWADIEDDAELVGDIDVDDFPTLAVFKAGQPLHFGASLPIEAVVTRLLARLAQSSATPTAAPSVIPSAVRELGARLSR